MKNIDSYLGDFRSRYFGAGHKETRYFLQKINPENKYIFKLKQIGIWSEKNGIEQTAHLSTIDGIILANMAAEIFIQNELMLANDEMYLAKFEIKASTSPIENLDKVFVDYINGIFSDKMIELHYRISGMKIILGYKNINDSVFVKLADHVQPQLFIQRENYISNHLRFLKHDIQNINNMGDKAIICDVLRKHSFPEEMTGINSNVPQIPSLIEWLVIFSQLAQVVAYNFDSIRRNQSNTLWMKYVKAEMKKIPISVENQAMAWGEISKTKLLRIKGKHWRTFNMFGEVSDYNVDFIGKIAHQLPDEEFDSEVQKDER